MGFNTHLIIMISNSLQAKIKLGFLDSQATDCSSTPRCSILSRAHFEYKLMKSSHILNAELNITKNVQLTGKVKSNTTQPE